MKVEETLGSTANVIEAGVKRGADASASLLDDIAKAIESAADYDAAMAAVDKAIAAHADDEALARMVAQPALVSDLLGRMTVDSDVGADNG